MIGELDHLSPRVTVIARPDDDTAGVLAVLVDDELAFECGSCGAWWYPAAGSTLDDELTCRTCQLAGYRRRIPVRRHRDPDYEAEIAMRTPEMWLAEAGYYGEPIDTSNPDWDIPF